MSVILDSVVIAWMVIGIVGLLCFATIVNIIIFLYSMVINEG